MTTHEHTGQASRRHEVTTPEEILEYNIQRVKSTSGQRGFNTLELINPDSVGDPSVPVLEGDVDGQNLRMLGKLYQRIWADPDTIELERTELNGGNQTVKSITSPSLGIVISECHTLQGDHESFKVICAKFAE